MDLGPDFRDFRLDLKGFRPYTRNFTSDFKIFKPDFGGFGQILRITLGFHGLQGF